MGVVPRLLLVHIRSGVRWRRCLSRSFYLFFSCVRGTKKELEKSPGSARISSIFLFAIHHGISWPLHNLSRPHRSVFILVINSLALLGFHAFSSHLSVLPSSH